MPAQRTTGPSPTTRPSSRRPTPPLLGTKFLLLWLLRGYVVFLCVASASLAQEASSRNFLNIFPTYTANNEYYFQLLLSRDSSIFAGSCSIVTSRNHSLAGYNLEAGVRTVFKITNASTPLDTSYLRNTLDAAYRADVVSELMVSMAVMFLESAGELPFNRTSAIPSSYLPSSYTGFTMLVNPAFPNVPITLDMLLMHISSITEANFDLGAAQGPNGTVPSLATFVSSLFSSPTTIFSTLSQPGLSTSYSYSRTNTALVSYIVEQILAASAAYSSLSGIGEFVFAVVLPPLGLTNTFLLNRNGQYIETTYPFPSTNLLDMRPYKTIQDLTADGTATLTTYPIHASYFSDYMLYTTTADLIKLAKGVLMPGGVYYRSIGVPMLRTSISMIPISPLNANGRTPGLFFFNPNLLCSILYQAVGSMGDLPYCFFSQDTIAPGAMAFGLAATGGNNQVAVVCIPLRSETFCSVAELSFRTFIAWPTADEVTGGYQAVGLAMVNLVRFASDPQPKAPESTSTKLNGWYIFVGVVASLAVVVGAAFGADYFIQPPPPAKIVAPVMTGMGNGGMRAGTALTEGARVSNWNSGNDTGSTEEPIDGESPKDLRDTATSSSLTNSSSRPRHGSRRHPQQHRRHSTRRGNANHPRRSREMDSGEDDNENYGGATDETPYLLRSASQQGGGSSLRRRRRRQLTPTSEDENDSYATLDDGWQEHDVEMAERSSTGSQRPNPSGMLRFDAYI